ncbi:hypothetical protein [Streptomyces aurantiogriseus]|uniref:hypothetical protein n=1 Tax=Streptomyces aurantiogriseus TaxID=66870 RepID=UPI00167A3CEC|nr:hypothetical protein [Streptomyces aurantiogriseus]
MRSVRGSAQVARERRERPQRGAEGVHLAVGEGEQGLGEVGGLEVADLGKTPA